MADYFVSSLTQQFINNSPEPTTVNKKVVPVVINGALVIDPKDINPGVIINNNP